MPRGVYERVSTLERFHEWVIAGPNDCLRWTGTHSSKGYARFWWDGNTRNAIIFIWEYHNGPKPPNTVLGHTCANKWCVNYEHVRPISNQINLIEDKPGYNKELGRLEFCPSGHSYSEFGFTNSKGYQECKECVRLYMLTRDRRR